MRYRGWGLRTGFHNKESEVTKKGTKTLALVSVLGAMLMLPPQPAGAQDNRAANMQIVRDAIQANKKLFIAQNMGLTVSEANAFWPVYDSYQKELGRLTDRSISLIENYANNYYGMSNETAVKLINEYLAIEGQRLMAMESYLPKFMKTLPAKKVARYYQLENKIRAIGSYDVARKIPLVK
jgi:hypothetical protein